MHEMTDDLQFLAVATKRGRMSVFLRASSVS
jgi:hypothetical protein